METSKAGRPSSDFTALWQILSSLTFKGMPKVSTLFISAEYEMITENAAPHLEG